MKNITGFIEKYAPTVLDKTFGATKNELNNISSLVYETIGKEPPKELLNYYHIFGHPNSEVCELLYDYGGDCDISEIIEYYKDDLIDGNEPITSNCITLFVGGSHYDEIALNISEKPYSVVSIGYGKIESVICSSFEKYIYSRIYSFYCTKLYNTKITMMSKDVSSELALMILRGNGASPKWFSDQYRIYFEKEQYVVIVQQYSYGVRVAFLFSKKPHEMDELEKEFAEASFHYVK